MARPKKGVDFKRINLGLTEEMDEAVIKVRCRKEYCRLSYPDCIRVLIREGAKAMDLSLPGSEGAGMTERKEKIHAEAESPA